MPEFIFNNLNNLELKKAKQWEKKNKQKHCYRVQKAMFKKHKNKEFSFYQVFDGLWKNLEKNFCVIVLIGVRDVDWLTKDWDEFDRGFTCCSSVFVLSHDSVVMLSALDRQAIECGRNEQRIGDEFADDEEDFLWL